MLSIAKANYKGKKYVEGYKKLIGKKEQTIEEHYNIIVDEISEGRINQQTLWAKADNKGLIDKLEDLEMYQPVKLLVNVSFYEGRPSKVTVLDIINDETEVATIEAIFKKQKQKYQEEENRKVQE